jgi:hypothetical protein
VLRCTIRVSRADAVAATLLWASCHWTALIGAEPASAPAGDALETVVVSARKLPEIVPDEVVREQVETALHDDPFFYDEHVTITVKNGVVHLPG